MRKNYEVLALALVLPLLGTRIADAEFIINFDGLAQNDASQHDIGPVYSTGGFTLTASHSDPIGNPPDFRFFGTESPFSPDRTALYHHISLGEISLTRTDGGSFDFYSIDLAELPEGDSSGNPVNSGPFNLTFYGTREDGTTVSDTVTVDSFLTLKTQNLTGFDDVVEVNWFQGGGPPSSPTHQFDNLAVEPVPEPSSLVLLGIGIAALTIWTWKRCGFPHHRTQGREKVSGTVQTGCLNGS